ncbi:trypsin-like serine peptidase [Ruegeria jejuensis]|uniref:trypsin-like serine peptidase n=1 Tax=Ruegeria jejuensis TaxID=3233338 RepID=UPI00355BC91A
MKAFLFLFLSLCLSLPLQAQNSGLRRLTDREDLLGWEAVGKLELGGGSYCTGTLIARDLVLTAAHCAVSKSTGKRFEPGQIIFKAGYSDGRALADREVTQIAVPENFQINGPNGPDRIRADVALLRLAAPIPLDVADPFALHSGNIHGAEISVSSYGQGRDEAISRQRSCRILNREEGLIVVDCDVTFGSSGSALLARSDSRWQILSVLSAGAVHNGEKIGIGMELPEIVAQLKRQLYRDAPRPKAGIKMLGVGSGRSSSGAKFIRPNGS